MYLGFCDFENPAEAGDVKNDTCVWNICILAGWNVFQPEGETEDDVEHDVHLLTSAWFLW